MKILIACQCASNKGDRAIAEYLMDFYLKQGIDVTLSTTQPHLWKPYNDKGVRIVDVGYKTLYAKKKNKFLIKLIYYFQKFFFDKLLFRSLISSKKHSFCNHVSKDFVKTVKEVDLVIVTGGHHLTTIREKNALFSVTYDIGLISLYSKKYILWSQTIGPLDFTSKRIKAFFEQIIEKAAYVFIRDNNSIDVLKGLDVTFNNIRKSFDTVFAFSTVPIQGRETNKKIGISIFNGLKKAFGTFSCIASLLDFYSEKGYAIEFFRMEYSREELDSINSVIKLMKYKKDITVFDFMTSTKEHLSEMSSCSFFIGYKTHSVIMALTIAVPLIAIAYHQKTIDFMGDFDLSDYSIMDTDVNLERLSSLANSIESNRKIIIDKEKRNASRIGDTINKDLYETIKKDEG